MNLPEDGPLFRRWPGLPRRRPLLAATIAGIVWGGLMALTFSLGCLIFLTEGLRVFVLALIANGVLWIAGGAFFGWAMHRIWTDRPLPAFFTRPGLPFLGSRGDE